MEVVDVVIKRFLGTSENAVKTQVWCAVATYVLIAIVKGELRLDASLIRSHRKSSASFSERYEAAGSVVDGRLDQTPP